MLPTVSVVPPMEEKKGRESDDTEEQDFESIQRVRSFPANFETNIGQNDNKSNESSTFATAARLQEFVHIQAEAAEPPECDDDVNLIKMAKTRQAAERCRSLSPVRPLRHISHFSFSLSPSSAVGGDAAKIKDGPISPFSLIENIPWFSSNDCKEGVSNPMLVLPTLDLLSNDNDKDDDNESVNSAAYFDPNDFDTSYWLKASMHVPTVGLALLAGITAFTHPVLFILGALTAFGTATAAIKGYDYIHSDNDDVDSLWQRVCSSSDLIDPCNGLLVPRGKQDTPVLKIEANADAVGLSESDAIDEEKKDDDIPIHSILKPDDNTPLTHRSSQTSVISAKQLSVHSEQMTGPEGVPDIPTEWIDLHYPPLSQTIVKNAKFVGLNCFEFFRVFFDDDAPYNFKVFQEKRGDINIQYNNWKHLPESGPISHCPRPYVTDFPHCLEYYSFQGRILTFKARTNSFIGPPWATTKKTQRILIFSKRLAVLESRTDLSDIPYCDRFFLVERWVIKAEKEVDRYITYVSTSCDVFFTSNCAFESQIRSKSTNTIRDIVTGWCVMATQALKLTEKAKSERLNRSQIESHGVGDDETIISSSTKKIPNEKLSESECVRHDSLLRSVCSNSAIEVTNLSQSQIPCALIVGEDYDDESTRTRQSEDVKKVAQEIHVRSTADGQENSPSFTMSSGWNVQRAKVWQNLRRNMTMNRSSQHR